MNYEEAQRYLIRQLRDFTDPSTQKLTYYYEKVTASPCYLRRMSAWLATVKSLTRAFVSRSVRGPLIGNSSPSARKHGSGFTASATAR